MKTSVIHCTLENIKVLKNPIGLMSTTAKRNKICISPVAFLQWRILGAVEMKMEATGLECVLLSPARLWVHGGRQTYVSPSPADAPVIPGQKEAGCTGMTDKRGLKEPCTGKFSFCNLGTEVGCCPLWYLYLCLLLKSKYSHGKPEWLTESYPSITMGHTDYFIWHWTGFLWGGGGVFNSFL